MLLRWVDNPTLDGGQLLEGGAGGPLRLYHFPGHAAEHGKPVEVDGTEHAVQCQPSPSPYLHQMKHHRLAWSSVGTPGMDLLGIVVDILQASSLKANRLEKSAYGSPAYCSGSMTPDNLLKDCD